MLPEAMAAMASREFLDEMPVTRAAILRLLKSRGLSSIQQMAETLGVTHEAVRKQVVDLERSGWIESDCPPDQARRREPGRPALRYCLTSAGDHFFPKQYPELLVTLLDSTSAEKGEKTVAAVLGRMTDEIVDRLHGIETLPLDRAVDELRAIYRDGDPFTHVERRGEDLVIVERNCPYLDVALERPAICSTTVSALRRLTACEVVRERRFQDGDGRCEFHVRAATRSPKWKEPRFEKEPPRS
jgi:predicted ArsR family transcriptional regulator